MYLNQDDVSRRRNNSDGVSVDVHDDFVILERFVVIFMTLITPIIM